MGQQANSGRHASLGEQNQRAAGRRGRTGQNAPGREQIRDSASPLPMKGKTSGAFGRGSTKDRKSK